jgi:2',3'-cyclic-nucleotide 2'-phosphodiesterase (5'-nucleotidase family)
VSFRILFTGSTQGYIEPCNCSRGLLGGLDRRTTAINENRSGQPTVLIDLGDLFEIPTGRPMTELGRRQAAFLSAEMERMGYAFTALGREDLTLAPEFLVENLPDLEYPPLLTNRLPGADLGVETVPRIRLDLGGLEVDIFNIIEPDIVAEKGAGRVGRWEQVLEEALEESSRGEDPADAQVVIAHVQFAVIDKIPEWYPDIDLLFHGGWQLPRQAFRIGTCVSMSPAGKGQMLGRLDASVLPRERQQENRPVFTGFQGLHIALPPEAPFDPEVRARMETFRAELIRDGLILP